MRTTLTTRALVLLVTASSTPVMAVDLAAIHDVAAKYDAELQAAAHRRQAAAENIDQAWSNYLPQISVSGSLTKGQNKSEVAGIDQPDTNIDTRSYQASLDQSIFSWRNIGQIDQARAQVSQAEAEYQSAYQAFLLRVAERYFQVLTARDSLRFARAEEKALQRQYEQAEQRFEVGLTAVTDVHEAKASYDQARSRTIIARNDLDDAHQALQEITGKDFRALDELREDLELNQPEPGDASEWVRIALANDPDLQRARDAAEIADASIEIERAGYLPTIDGFVRWQRFSNQAFPVRNDEQVVVGETSFISDDTQIGLQFNWQLFSGLGTFSRTRQARREFRAAEADVDFEQRATVRATRNAYRAVMADIREVEARRQALVSAESALEATEAGFEVGTRTIVDVLLSEQRFFQAQRDHSRARHDYIVDQLRLRQAAGILEPEDLVAINKLLVSPEQ